MDRERYEQLTRELTDRLSSDSRVIGLVAVGSMSEQDYLPDEWSDHDFFVVVQSGTQENFRNDLSWLPGSDSIIFQYRETAHGIKALYRSGHLLEFAIFDLNELHLAKINRYRILMDRANVEQHLSDIKAETLRWSESLTAEDRYLFGQFLTNVLVGFARDQRGEKLSGQQFVKSSAIRHLVILLARYLPSPQKNMLDNIDPYRRFERAYPAIGKELNELCNQEVGIAAEGLLKIVERELQSRVPVFPKDAFETVRRTIRVTKKPFS